MSFNQLYQDVQKSWCDIRVNNLKCDSDVSLENGNIIATNGNISATNGDIEFGGNLVNLAGPYTFNYEEFTGNLNMTGPWTGTIAYKAVKIGNVVNLNLENVVDTSTAPAILQSSNFPVNLRPNGADPFRHIAVVEDNTTAALGIVEIDAQLQIGVGVAGGSFTGSGSCGLLTDLNITYSLL